MAAWPAACRLEVLSAAYSDSGLIPDKAWTFPLFDCWARKSKITKHAVHIPCWDSCRILPCKWRGIVFGRCQGCMTAVQPSNGVDNYTYKYIL